MIWNRAFVSSDHHFNHRKILEYCERPFDSPEEMNAAFVSNHNKIVRPNDFVFFLGDFAFHPATTKKFLEQLNGRIHFIWGNHDKRTKKVIRSLCEWTGGLKVIVGGKRKKITLCHFPMESWDGSNWGHLHFHGHCHGTRTPTPGMLDVGIDNAYKLLGEYRPFSIQEAIEFVPKRDEEK